MSKTVVISGATKGIGRALVDVFAAKGFDLAICARTASDLEELQEELKNKYPTQEVLSLATDVSKREDILAFSDLVKKNWTKIDVIINNAGVFTPGSIADEPEGALENMIETNVYSAYHLTRALLPTLVAQKTGHIFNMCSIASLFAYPNGGSYSISKFALLGFSKVLREELKEQGIRVTSVLPGATWTASWEGSGVEEDRIMKASDIAETILSAYQMSKNTVIEEIILRPQLGDL